MTIETIDELAALLQHGVVNSIAIEGTDYGLELERPAGLAVAAAPAAPPGAAAEATNVTTVESPVVGVFHEAVPAVMAGDGVKAGKVLGFVEALALPNEVRSPIDGVVSAVHVEDGQPVEFGQALFTITPASGQ